jgi:hypothetical protein
VMGRISIILWAIWYCCNQRVFQDKCINNNDILEIAVSNLSWYQEANKKLNPYTSASCNQGLMVASRRWFIKINWEQHTLLWLSSRQSYVICSVKNFTVLLYVSRLQGRNKIVSAIVDRISSFIRLRFQETRILQEAFVCKSQIWFSLQELELLAVCFCLYLH